MRGGKRDGAGRKPGTTRGKRERITIQPTKDNLEWLREQDGSYSKVINSLIDTERQKA